MAIYHFSAQIISRSQGRSSVASAAYRSGEKLQDERTGLIHDYARKSRVIYSEILTPNNAPEWASNRQKLWNEVEKIEKSKDSQLAREINIALPKELSKEQNIELIKNFIKDNFVSRGMAADIAIHDGNNDDKNKISAVPVEEKDNNKNIHAHVMLTMRPFNEDGTWGAKAKKEYILNKKGEKIKLKSGEYKSRKIETTDWNKKETLENWREQWANYANKALEKAGFAERIDHRTLEDQGIDRIAQIHVGAIANNMDKRANKRIKENQEKIIVSDRGNINQSIKETNKQLNEIEKEKVIAIEEYKKLKEKLENEKAKEVEKYSNLKTEERSVIEKAEKIIKEPLTYKNSKKALEKLNSMNEEENLKLSKINSNANEITEKLHSINYNLEALKKAEKELNELPKNILGMYKDKNRADNLKSEIEMYKNELNRNGYRKNVDIRINEIKLQKLQSEIEKSKVNIQRIDGTSNILKMGVKALQNKEIREFYKEYKEYFPKSRYFFNYNEMKAVKAIGEIVGRPVSVQHIKSIYKDYCLKLENVDQEFRDIESDKRRIINAKKAIEIIDKYKDIAEKWDTKIFGKAKFQKDHINEKLVYDNSKAELKACGVRDKFDLIQQERTCKIKVNTTQPKLQKDKSTISSAINVLSRALQAISNSERTAQYNHDDMQHKKHLKQKNLGDDDLSL